MSYDSSPHEISVQQFNKWQHSGADYFLLDVREAYEYDIVNLGGYLIPLSELLQRTHELDASKQIIVYCKSGGRSKKAVELLRRAGFHSVLNLTGGIMAWREYIDPRVPLY